MYPLTPKYHYMTHYPHILHSHGPLRNFWCMRFEAKHAEGKQTARNSTSRVNLPQSIAIDHQLRLAYVFVNDLILTDLVQKGPNAVIGTFDETYTSHKWVKFNGRLYKVGRCVLHIGVHDDFPDFGLVSSIFVKEKDVVFACTRIQTFGFNEHRHSYTVQQSKNSRIVYINIKDL